MPVSGDTAIRLSPRSADLPLGLLLEAWRRTDFEPRAGAAALEAWLEKFAVPQQWFRPEELLRGNVVATSEFLFRDPMEDGQWDWGMSAKGNDSRFLKHIPQSSVEHAARITRALHHFADPQQFAAAHGDDLESPIQEAIGSALSRTSDFGSWPDIEAGGIYRREHASVAFRTADTTVLFDPQGYSGSRTTAFARYPADRDPRVDAVIVTHSHADHWHLPSVLRHCDEETRVIVPHVPRANLLTPVNFSAALAIAGQEHECLNWNRAVRVGEIEIQALPFHGEQATGSADFNGNDLRIWSNCYALRCAKFSALVLVDGGIDPGGEMRAVVQNLVARDGRFDVVLSSCGRQALSATSPAFSLAMRFSRLREAHANRKRDYHQKITQGISCVAEICAIAKARYFLPIAHGFNGLEEEIFIDGQKTPESVLLTALEIELRRVAAPTQIVFWWVGDRFPIGDVELPD